MSSEKSSKVREKVQKIISLIQGNRYLKAVTSGLASTLAIMVIGAFSSLFGSMNIGSYQQWIAPIKNYIELPVNFTTNLVAVYAAFTIGYSLTKSFKISGMQGGLTSLLAFMLVTPVAAVKIGKAPATVLPFQWLGAAGLFAAIIVGLISARIYVYIVQRHWTLKMPAGVPPMISNSFAALVPTILVAIIFTIVAVIFDNTPYGSLHQLIYGLIQTPLTHLGNTLSATLIVVFLMQLLWVLGIHGGMVGMSIMTPIWTAMTLANLKAFRAGQPRPYLIAGLSSFVMIAPMLGLVICLLFFAKSKQLKTVGKLGAPGALFGIHEPLIFGLPIVLNAYLAIPYIVSPLVCLIIAYISVVTGLIPIDMGMQVPFGTPVILDQLMRGSWKFVVLELILIPICALIYYPFVKAYDKSLLANEKAAVENQHESKV